MAATKIDVRLDLIPTDCCVCGVWFALPERIIAERRKDGKSFYCPNGHSMVYTNSEFDQLKQAASDAKERERNAYHQAVQLREERDRLANDLMDQAKEHKRIMRRVHGGVCPHCSRTFQNLQAHVARQHPNQPGVVKQPPVRRPQCADDDKPGARATKP